MARQWVADKQWSPRRSNYSLQNSTMQRDREGDVGAGATAGSSSLPELPHLTELERHTILRVLQRDEMLRRQHHLRVLRLRAELQSLRRKGALKVTTGESAGAGASLWPSTPVRRVCGRCRSPLGCLLNRGAECRSCRLRVCKPCRQFNAKATDWVCAVCFKQMEIQAATGEWMNEFVRRPSRRRDNRVYVPAADLIKRSIRRSWTISNPQSHPRPLVMSRLSPEMRAYSSLPRHSTPRLVQQHTSRESEFEAGGAQMSEDVGSTSVTSAPLVPLVPWSEIVQQRRLAAQQLGGDNFSPSSSSSSRDRSPDPVATPSKEGVKRQADSSPGMGRSKNRGDMSSPPPSSGGEDFDVETLSGAVFRKVTVKKRRQDKPQHASVAAASPSRDKEVSRRVYSQPGSEEEGAGAAGGSGAGGSPAPSPAAAYLLDYALDAGKIQPESDDYKLVFISSDSSSKGSNSDIEFTTDDCDWDYFESTLQQQKQEQQQIQMQQEHEQQLAKEASAASSTSLLGSGSFSDTATYERSNYTQAYLNRHFKDRGSPDEITLPDFHFDRYWSGLYGGNTTEFLRWTGGGMPSSRHPCENCGSDAASLLQGLCTGTNLIPVPVPYPVPVPVPVPFGAEADLAYLDNAIRIKIRSFQPPPPHILLQASPFGFNWQSILRNENLTQQSAAASWINTEKAEEKQQPVQCNKPIESASAAGAGGSVPSEKAAQQDVSTAVMATVTSEITTPVESSVLSAAGPDNESSSCKLSIQCDMVETSENNIETSYSNHSESDIPIHESDNELEENVTANNSEGDETSSGDEMQVATAPSDSESSSSDSADSDDENDGHFSRVFVVNPEHEDDNISISSNLASSAENNEIIGGVQLKHIRQLDIGEDPGYGSELSEGMRNGRDLSSSIDDLNSGTDTETANFEPDPEQTELHISEDEAADGGNNIALASENNLISQPDTLQALDNSTVLVTSCASSADVEESAPRANSVAESSDTAAASMEICPADEEIIDMPLENDNTKLKSIDDSSDNKGDETVSDSDAIVPETATNNNEIMELQAAVSDVDNNPSDDSSDEREAPDDKVIVQTALDTINNDLLDNSDVIGSETLQQTEPQNTDGEHATIVKNTKNDDSIGVISQDVIITKDDESETESNASSETDNTDKIITHHSNVSPEINIAKKEISAGVTECKDDTDVEETCQTAGIVVVSKNDVTTPPLSGTENIHDEENLAIVESDLEVEITENPVCSDNTTEAEICSNEKTSETINNSDSCKLDNNETDLITIEEVKEEHAIKNNEKLYINELDSTDKKNTDEIVTDLDNETNKEEISDNESHDSDNNEASDKIAVESDIKTHNNTENTPTNMILHITEADIENHEDNDDDINKNKNYDEGKDYDLVPLHDDLTSTPAVMGADIAAAAAPRAATAALAAAAAASYPSGAVEPESASDTQSPRNSGGYTSYVMITQDGGNSENTNDTASLSEDERVNVSVIEVSEDEVKINHTNSGDELNPSELINDTPTGLAGYFTLTLETGVQSSSPTPRRPEVKLKKTVNLNSEYEDSVQIITGDKTMSHAVLCLEEGLADDDSWVEEVDDVDSSNFSESSGDEAYMDREEELRGYHRAIDFTLHTILEESCEESDDDAKPSTSGTIKKEDKTELEKYFFFGLGGSQQIKNDEEISDTQSESSVISDALQEDDVIESKQLDPAELASSRLEKYFLTSFLEPPSADALSDNTDESGSVGSDSEGKPSPEQRRKKLVRARGTGRHSDRGPDSLAPSDVSGSELPETNDDSTETDSYNDEPNFGIDGLDTVKRKKKKQPSRLSNSTPNISTLLSSPPPSASAAEELQAQAPAAESGSEPEDGAKTPQPDLPADPPPPSRKHHSRDSGFIGSCDDLLRTGPSGSSSGAGSGGSGSDRELETAPVPGETTPTVSPAPPSSPVPPLPSDPPPNITKPSPVPPARANLARKDSFNNWSSDEETNLMMCKMRAFFKTMVAGGNKNNGSIGGSSNSSNSSAATATTSATTPPVTKVKPPQLVYFESELTRLMKTVPGIKDEQVREIVEYLSSEDTWSDSYDSSDYTSSDLEGATFGPRTELQQQISASCQEIIQKFDSSSLSDTNESPQQREDSFVYQRLVASLSRVASNETNLPATPVHNSPPLIAKVMHHIGSRLVALMHEVSAAGDPSALLASSGGSAPSPKPRFRRLQRQQQSPTSSSVDESDSPGGSDTERGASSRMRRHPSLPRSKSHDLGQWQQLLQDAERRAVPRDSLRSSSSGVSDLAEEREDYERFSWRGSFESALAADSRTKLSLEAKRRSTGSGSGSASDLFSSNDQLDRRGRVRSCGSIGSRASLPGRAGTRLSSSGGDLLTAAENEEGLLDANSRRRGSVPDAITPRSTTLPRSNPAVSASTNSLPRLPLSASPVVAAIHKSYSAQLHAGPSTPPHQSPHHTHHHHFLQNVKSARYRPPNFRPPSLGPPKRAVSAPGLHHARRPDRRRGATLGEDGAAGGLLDEVAGSSSSLSTPATPQTTPQGTLQQSGAKNGCGSSPAALNKEWPAPEDDIDRLVAIHQQRSNMSALGARSDSMASVYSGAGEGRYGTVAVRGEVEFGLQYNYKAGALEILVKQCRDLAPVDAKRNRSDPYVKVYLLPDKSKSGKRKTKVKKHTLNPVFDETLKFHMTLHGLETRTLWLTVWHSDMFGRNDFLGEVMMVLENKVFDDPTPKWYPLQERTEPFEDLLCYKGDIIVGLKFVPPDVTTVSSSKKSKRSRGALHVLVKEAKNLTAVKASGSSDPFCKSYLLPDKGRGSKQKTSVARRTCNPAWNHTFVYEDVSLQELSERSLELTVWDHDRLASNEFLGGLRFNLGSGKHFGKNVDWMDATGREMTLWQRMLERPNFWVEGSLTLRPSLDLRNSSSSTS